MLTHGIDQGRPELLDPAQDRPPADVDPAVGEHASDAFGRGTQLEAVADGEHDGVTREVAH
jgi:hypothetical protein